jgi:ubiquinone/menaquinone biosynthesis C-methylase UbiE
MRDFGNGVFGGTAEYYDKYRPGYPPKMFQDIVQFFGLDGRGELLDLGCGTGELALPLAKFFSSVLAIDPEPGMLGLGARKSLELGLANIQWRKGSSEDLKSLQRLFRLVALGQSFHWMDQETVINQLYGRIQPGGGLFIVGTAPITQNQPTTIKNELIKEMLIKYLGPQRRAGNSIYTKPPKPYRELLSCSKFNGYKKANL